jgi:hypothetical protein
MAMKSLTDKDWKETIILEWYKYAAIANKKNYDGKNMYLFLIDASDADAYETDGDGPLGTKELLGKEICQQELYR